MAGLRPAAAGTPPTREDVSLADVPAGCPAISRVVSAGFATLEDVRVDLLGAAPQHEGHLLDDDAAHQIGQLLLVGRP